MDYSSEKTCENLVTAFKKAFHGLEPYNWQLDVTEALLLGFDCVMIWIRNEFWYVPTDGPEKNREVYVD